MWLSFISLLSCLVYVTLAAKSSSSRLRTKTRETPTIDETNYYEAYLRAVHKLRGNDRAYAIAKVAHSYHAHPPSHHIVICSVAVNMMSAWAEQAGKRPDVFADMLWVARKYFGEHDSPMVVPFEEAVDLYFNIDDSDE